jgi:hypothetical protein
MTTTNLWGELPDVVPIKTPKMLVAEQAALLQEMTKGSLTADVVSEDDLNRRIGGISNSMRLIAPSIGNYSVVLLKVNHDVMVYPCRISSPFLDLAWGQCNSEAELEDALKNILQDPKTRNLISNLLAQIRAENSVAA